jgi:hypothetical protein
LESGMDFHALIADLVSDPSFRYRTTASE